MGEAKRRKVTGEYPQQTANEPAKRIKLATGSGMSSAALIGTYMGLIANAGITPPEGSKGG